MKHQKILILFSFLILLFSVSCKKMAEDRIDGYWMIINTTNSSSTRVEEWNFTNDKIYFHRSHQGIPNSDTIYWADYRIKANPFRRKLFIENSNLSAYSGEWIIKKLNRKYMILMATEGVSYLEFSKE